MSLHHMILPPYDIPGVIVVSGVLAENRTNKSVNNIRIHIEYDPTEAHLHHIQIVSDDEYILRGGGEGNTFATVRLRQVRPGGRVVVYFAATKPIDPKVEVTTWSGR